MNPAKAAPSAPVKKAARKDPQILPDGLLILFFLLLAVGEAVQRHPNDLSRSKYGLQAADFQGKAMWGVIWLADK